jgi:hypothetical protein
MRSLTGRRIAVLFAVLALAPGELAAQRSRPAGQAFAIEAAGATAGSLIAVVAAHQVANRVNGACPVEDLGCLIRRIGLTGAASVAGAAGGGYLAGRIADTRPSGPGSVLGAVVGVAAGAGALHLIGENLDIHARPTLAITYAVVQGLSTALLSRALARD